MKLVDCTKLYFRFNTKMHIHQSDEYLRKKGNDAYRREDYNLALEIFEKMAISGDPHALFTCGLIYEGVGGFDHPDLCKAWSYYERLHREHDFDEGYLGCVRIMLRRKETLKWKVARQYCERVIKLNRNAFAYLLLGDVVLNLAPQPSTKEAAKAYLTAAARGAPWGLRRYANMKKIEGYSIFSLTIHLVATILFPFYILVFGFRATRTG